MNVVFGVCMCKMLTSGAFFILPKFWFSGLIGGLKDKKWPKMTRNSVGSTPYHMIVIFGHM